MVYRNGTKVSRYFRYNFDNDNDYDRVYAFETFRYGERMEGVVVSHGFTVTRGSRGHEMLQKKYRVHFTDVDDDIISCDMSNDELELCLHKNCPYHLCRKYFRDVLNILNDPPADGDGEGDADGEGEGEGDDYTRCEIDWEAFSKDLDRVPMMAEIPFELEAYNTNVSIFFLVLIMPNRPSFIIRKLLERQNPLECHPYSNWLAIALDVAEKTGKDSAASLFDLDADMLQRILKKTNGLSTTRQVSLSALAPVHKFCGSTTDNYVPPLAATVLDVCDDAVALVLADHYRGIHPVSQAVQNYALACSKKRSSKQTPSRLVDCFYCINFRDKGNVTGLSLMEEIFHFVDSEKLPLFERFLKHYYVRTSTSNRNLVANVSLTNMVLYALEDMSNRLQHPSLGSHLLGWTKFVATQNDIKTLIDHRKTEKLVMSPLLYAISLGFPWNPVLRDLVAGDPSALESVDFVELLPPFLMAATFKCTLSMCTARVANISAVDSLNDIRSRVRYYHLDDNLGRILNPAAAGSLSIFEKEDNDRAIMENAFELLKANPAMITGASEKGNAEAARKSVKARKKQTNKINGKRKFVQSSLAVMFSASKPKK